MTRCVLKMSISSNTTLGVTFNVIASMLFALMFAYTALLDALQGNEIYGWRILLTFPCLTLFVIVQGQWSQVQRIYQRIIKDPYFLLTRFVSSALIGVQLWLFMWAPANGYGLDVALGYFMMLIAMVVLGAVAFREKMSTLQKISCAFAVIGVLNLLLVSSSLSWVTLLICLGYPLYFWLRQISQTNNVGGLWFDMIPSLPISLFFIIQGGVLSGDLGTVFHATWLILGLGLISALALGFQSLSAPHLNISLFGLLVYVEPILLLGVALMLGESIQGTEWLTYIAIWLAVSALCLEAILHLRKPAIA